MNLQRFDELMNGLSNRGDLMQESSEWLGFMEFISAYFENRGIAKPLIVEIGIYHGATQLFYEQLLSAEYVGIDMNPDARPDILGDSGNSEILDELQERLDGRKIDLLFIDGDHGHKGVKRDYELYAPLVRHLIALHDVIARRQVSNDAIEVYRLWEEIVAMENTIVFKGAGWCTPGRQTPLGIGVIIKCA